MNKIYSSFEEFNNEHQTNIQFSDINFLIDICKNKMSCGIDWHFLIDDPEYFEEKSMFIIYRDEIINDSYRMYFWFVPRSSNDIDYLVKCIKLKAFI